MTNAGKKEPGLVIITQFMPNEGAKPTYPTELNIQYDDKNLYVAFSAYDGEPEKIVRMAGVRDEIVGDMMGLTFRQLSRLQDRI